MTIFFTSDIHFGHARVIPLCNRPFATVEEMDDAIIGHWNALVQPADTVYIVGDVSFHKPTRTAEIVASLHGTKILVRGNHDKKLPKDVFTEVHDLHTAKIPDEDAVGGIQRIVLCHYALRVWDKRHYGAWHLYGHSHGTLPEDVHAKSFDVGMDCWNYQPISYDVVKAKMTTKTDVPPDHHGMQDAP